MICKHHDINNKILFRRDGADFVCERCGLKISEEIFRNFLEAIVTNEISIETPIVMSRKTKAALLEDALSKAGIPDKEI